MMTGAPAQTPAERKQALVERIETSRSHLVATLLARRGGRGQALSAGVGREGPRSCTMRWLRTHPWVTGLVVTAVTRMLRRRIRGRVARLRPWHVARLLAPAIVAVRFALSLRRRG